MSGEHEHDEVVALEVELEPPEPDDTETEEGSADPLELLAAPARLAKKLLGAAAEELGEALTPDDTDASEDDAGEDE